MKPIVLLDSPILAGTNLIEASAGTGKTQTIAGLFLRLLLETDDAPPAAPIQVDQILVLTYTEAATEELRERIRTMLVRALHAFEQHAPGSDDAQFSSALDPFLSGLVRRHAARRSLVIERLRLSINCFDLAPIFTIHGFCQRALKDRAFESGSLFDAEVLSDQSTLMREVADDFWRRTFYHAGPLPLAMALANGLSADQFLPLLKSSLSHPGLRFIARTNDQPDAIAARLQKSFDAARQIWRADAEAIRACFGSSRKWGNQPYNDDRKMAPLLAGVDRLFAGTEVIPDDLSALRKFSASALQAAVTRARRREPEPVPQHEFFVRCDEIFRHGDDYAVALKRAFYQQAQTELQARKDQLKVLSYDDLLTRLRDALVSPGGAELGAELRRRYRAALIDEFQDTDPVQAEIFERIFIPQFNPGGPDATGPHRLFFIGDPKQAIYGFRGADIFSYLHVAERAEHRFTLGENWRSDSGLVRAVNAFFSEAVHPFVFSEIGFEPVTPKGRADEKPLRLEGAKAPALQIWFCPRDGTGEIPKGVAEEQLPRAVAAEISRLLAGPNRIGDRLLRPQDFAVLVMTHHQAQLVQDALGPLGIPSVQQTQESVFASSEAVELLRVLSAIAHPSFEAGVRAALATRLWGIDGTELHRLQHDEPGWQRHLECHRRYLEEWSSQGFAAMFRLWVAETGLRARLIANPEGERALTNLLHLGELLHHAAAAEKLGPVALTKWLATRVGSDEAATDEHQLRLERDENAVQIVTVHKSKGLQYEIVFAPFCWRETDPSQSRRGGEKPEILFHHWDTGELLRDLNPEPADAHVRQTAAERLAEGVRLLYVALTRARHRCYLAWGAFKNAGSSAPAWILHRARGHTEPPAAAGAMPYWELDLAATTDDELRADLEARAAASVDPDSPDRRPTIAITELPLAPGVPYQSSEEITSSLHCREFTRQIESDWRIASFSWMTAGQHLERGPRTDQSEAPDRDPDDLAPAEPPAAATGIFAFPRGSRAGTCLHGIFEHFDLAERDAAELEKVVRRQLTLHGVDNVHTPGVVAAVQKTLAAPLDTPDATRFCLHDVRKESRQTELEFCFALRPLDPAQLNRIFAHVPLPSWAAGWPEQIGQLNFSPTRGFMKGFIDLVCEYNGRYHLIDWKSNWLGNDVRDYHPAAIQREMVARFYVLQYHLYAVALHRHLQLRLPGYQHEKHFGGVHYLFLRGIDPSAPGHGIFSDRPTAACLAQLTEALLLQR